MVFCLLRLPCRVAFLQYTHTHIYTHERKWVYSSISLEYRDTICFSWVEKYERSSYVTIPATLTVIGVRICSGSISSVAPDSYIISYRSNNFTRRFFSTRFRPPYCYLYSPCINRCKRSVHVLFTCQSANETVPDCFSVRPIVRCRRDVRRAHAIRMIENHIH